MIDEDKIVLSEYYGHKATANRKAVIVKDNQGLVVELYDFGRMVERRPVYKHNKHYAEDAAENYVLGIFDVITSEDQNG